MGLLRRIQSRFSANKSKSTKSPPTESTSTFSPKSSRNVSLESNKFSDRNYNSLASHAPVEVLSAIFSYICPHGTDDTYLSSEDSLAGNGCPLCNARDLAQASKVCRRWYTVAQRLLYQNVRLEQVHFCELEEELWRRRNRRSFFSSGNTDSNEPIKQRMRLLYRTIQENEAIANTVLYLKAPFWVREGCKQELTLLVSLLPNLRYVDLPQAVYQADVSCPLLATLKSRSAHLRAMGWRSGSEHSFVNMSGERPWIHLETIELSKLKIDDAQLLTVLHTLPNLQTVKLEEMAHLTDAMFDNNPDTLVMGFPPVRTLELSECPNLTISGLRQYLLLQEFNPILENLTLIDSGILPDQLNTLLPLAHTLRTLTINSTVSRPCQQVSPTSSLKPLTSTSLREITFDITNSESCKGLTSASPSYYTYLADSLCNGYLPSLRKMHVNEVRFAVRLKSNTVLDPLDYPGDMEGKGQKVDVYCKGHTETTWKWYQWICLSQAPPSSPTATNTNPINDWSSNRSSRSGRSSTTAATTGGKMMSVIDMEPEKTYTTGRGFLAVPGAGSPMEEKEDNFLRPISRKEKKKDKRRSLNDTYGMGAEYY